MIKKKKIFIFHLLLQCLNLNKQRKKSLNILQLEKASIYLFFYHKLGLAFINIFII